MTVSTAKIPKLTRTSYKICSSSQFVD